MANSPFYISSLDGSSSSYKIFYLFKGDILKATHLTAFTSPDTIKYIAAGLSPYLNIIVFVGYFLN